MCKCKKSSSQGYTQKHKYSKYTYLRKCHHSINYVLWMNLIFISELLKNLSKKTFIMSNK